VRSLLFPRSLLVGFASLLIAAGPAYAQRPSFDDWLTHLIAEARGKGFSDDLLQDTLAGLTPLHRVIASDRKQAEYTLTLDEYIRRRVTPEVIREGRELADEHRDVLKRVHDTYGVPPEIVLSIWAIESRYGRWGGDVPVFQALATLAWEPRRATMFRAQLYDALRMVDRGHIDAASMKGSWAGAMGQPQFLPSSYLAYAVDFDGDGRRDIWTSHADVFASIANYLKQHGWRKGESWGREVSEPKRVNVARRASGCRAQKEMTAAHTVKEWQKLGVRTEDGDTLSGDGRVSLVRSGTRRFLVGRNYDAILHYNCAHHYALTVAILAGKISE
jgi:membrane-bound lytic murein transglycosylase B